MTRWARARGAASKKALEATPWAEMTPAGAAAARHGEQSSPNRPSLKSIQGKHKKKNRKKKDYLNEDVNGFMEYLKQNSHDGKVVDSHEAREEIASVLKKDQRREVRRLKRQDIKKNTMVRLGSLAFPSFDVCYLTPRALHRDFP